MLGISKLSEADDNVFNCASASAVCFELVSK